MATVKFVLLLRYFTTSAFQQQQSLELWITQSGAASAAPL